MIRFHSGQRVGVPWLGKTCQHCTYCTGGQENLCAEARFTGYHIDGGFAEYTVANQQFAFPLSKDYPAAQVVPLLCAGLIGYRSLGVVSPFSLNESQYRPNFFRNNVAEFLEKDYY